MFGPKDGLLYVSTELENSITAIDPHALKIVGSIPTGKPESHMFAITQRWTLCVYDERGIGNSFGARSAKLARLST